MKLKSLAAALSLIAFACSETPKSEPKPAVAPPSSTAPAVATDATDPAATSAPSPGAVAITPFGVPECDNYAKKFLSCIEGKVTGDQKAALMAGFEENRTKWRALATMQQGAVALSLACRAANQKSKEELAVEYGCEF